MKKLIERIHANLEQVSFLSTPDLAERSAQEVREIAVGFAEWLLADNLPDHNSTRALQYKFDEYLTTL